MMLMLISAAAVVCLLFAAVALVYLAIHLLGDEWTSPLRPWVISGLFFACVLFGLTAFALKRCTLLPSMAGCF